MERKPVNFEGSVDTVLPSKPHWYRFIPIGIFIAAILFHSLIIFFYLPPVQFQKYTIASRMYLNEELPKERLFDFSPLYLYMHIVLQKIFPSTDVIVQWLQIVLLGFSSVLLFYLLFEFFQLLVALFGTVAFILNYSVVIYTQVFEPEPLLIFFLLSFVFFACSTLQYLVKSRKRLWVLPLLALFCLLLYIQTDFMREEDHLWESTRASRQFLRASFQNRGEGHFNEAAHLSAMAAAAAPWSIDSRRLSNLSFGTAGFVESALRVVFPLTASRRFDRAALYIEAGKADEAAKIIQQLVDEGYKFKRDYYQSSEPVMLEEKIISVFRKLSERSQNDVDKLYDYGIVLRQFGFHSQALRVQREGQVLDASNPRIKQEVAFLEKILLLPRKRERKRSNGPGKSH